MDPPRPAPPPSVPPPFDRVVEQHGALVWRVCRAVCGPVDAEDAWSETFLAALAAYPRLDPGSDVVAWLVVIAHRKAIDQHRRAARAPLPVAELPEGASRTGLPGEGEPDLWAAVAALPPKQRAAVAHHHLAGLPHAEVGRLLGTSEAAARRSASDGVRALRASYPRGDR